MSRPRQQRGGEALGWGEGFQTLLREVFQLLAHHLPTPGHRRHPVVPVPVLAVDQ